MHDIQELFSNVTTFVWPALAIWEIVISNNAKTRHGGEGPNLMFIGSILSAVAAGFYFFLNLSNRFGWYDYDFYLTGDLSDLYFVFGICGVLGNILFLAGLNQFVKQSRETKRGESRLLDRY